MATNVRYVGVKNGGVYVVTSGLFRPSEPDVNVIEVPPELSDVSAGDIITDYRVSGNTLRRRRSTRPASQLKLAFIGNWKMQCGIATYSENLLPHVAASFSDVKLFIEENDKPTGPVTQMGQVQLQPEQVLTCWRRGGSLQALVDAVKEYDPDVVWIQHEFGIWPHAGRWLSMLSQLSDYRVIVTMHSVFHHKDKTIVEAAMPEIIVHLEGARKVLQEEKGITSPVHVLPHGCNAVSDGSRLWNFYKSEHTFMQFGFGFRYKGWEKSIKAAAILKRKHPDVFFTGLYSESTFNKIDHQVYYNELRKLVDDLDLRENVAIIRGYQSDAALDSYLRTNQVIVFPYVSQPEHEVFGVSGAARLAMSKSAPVVTTNVNHFSDVPTLKGDTPEELAAAIDTMFSDKVERQKQIESQLKYLNDNTWEKVATLHVKLFENER